MSDDKTMPEEKKTLDIVQCFMVQEAIVRVLSAASCLGATDLMGSLVDGQKLLNSCRDLLPGKQMQNLQGMSKKEIRQWFAKCGRIMSEYLEGVDKT